MRRGPRHDQKGMLDHAEAASVAFLHSQPVQREVLALEALAWRFKAWKEEILAILPIRKWRIITLVIVLEDCLAPATKDIPSGFKDMFKHLRPDHEV